MKKILLAIFGAVLAFVAYFLISKKVNSVEKLKLAVFEATHDRDAVAEKEAFTIGYNAYLWGLVRVKTMLLQQKAIHPKYQDYAPLNQFAVSKGLAKPSFTDFTPNCDTYYGLAWLDVSKCPIIMDIPEVSKKYWTIQATDASLNSFHYIGSRLNSQAGKWAFCKSDWQGTLPQGVVRVNCSTNTVFLQARNLVIPQDSADERTAQRLLNNYKLQPLDPSVSYRSVDPNSPIPNPLNTNPDFRSLNFFKLLNAALTIDPPQYQEQFFVKSFERLGIGENQNFDENKLTQAQKDGLADGMMAGLRRVYDELKFGGQRLGGFNFRYDLGKYDHNYPLGAAVAFYGYGANIAEEALYVTTLTDAKDAGLTGSNSYKIHFNKDQLPPVHAFWSITLYTQPDNQLAANEIGRHNIGGLTPNLQYNADGSLDILIQHDKPAATNNWLPAPEGSFWLILRLYHPKQEILDRKYTPPLVERQ